ncbi:MAG: acetate--CoA ligase family protein, partial [Planctomycetes bacterium]|nr:acetate--CoA ligase family protein [Planctomycetota bacterium]
IFTCWLGGDSVRSSRALLASAGVPGYETPENAVGAFHQLVAHARNQELLREVPPAAPESGAAVDRDGARHILEEAARAGREWLDPRESLAVLAAYGVPAAATRRAGDAAAAARFSCEMGFPVALKIVSPQATHKSEVGGVALGLASESEVRAAAERMIAALACHAPGARIDGFVVQRMVERRHAVELLAGAVTDPLFGPVLLFGTGGTAAEAIADRAIALPPLNEPLARDLIARTRAAALLAGHRGKPAADERAVANATIAISRLISEQDAILELDANPLLADDAGVIAVDARIRVARAGAGRTALAIRPYPLGLEERWVIEDRQLSVRPIRPEDDVALRAFFESLDPGDSYFRFFRSVRQPERSQIARYAQIDYDREMAFVAFEGGEIAALAQALTDPDNIAAEYSLVVLAKLRGRGLGGRLLAKLIDYQRARGTERLVGQVLTQNARMMRLVSELGFELRGELPGGITEVSLSLGRG